MKIKLVFRATGVALFAALFLAGCASTKPLVWDNTLSEAEMATVNLVYGITATSYNGVPIEDKAYTFKLPAGDAEFVADIVWNSANTITRGKELSFSYYFEGGKEYTLGAIYGGKNDSQPVIKVFSGHYPALGYPSEDNLLDEIIFERQQRVMTAGSK